VTLGGTLAAGMLFTGGVGVDTITLGASTKAITTNDGHDVVVFRMHIPPVRPRPKVRLSKRTNNRFNKIVKLANKRQCLP
jgi:hypothetical protein